MKFWALAMLVFLFGCSGSPLQEAAQEQKLSGAAEVSAGDVQELTNTNTQVSSQTSEQRSVQGSDVQAESVQSVQTEVTTNNGIVLTIPIILGGLVVVLLLGWLIPAPPWFSAIFGGKQ